MLCTSGSHTFWRYFNRTRIDGFISFKNPPNWKKYIYHSELSWNFQSVLGKALIPVGKEKDKARQILLEMTRRKKSLMTTSQFHRKHLMVRHGSMTRMQCNGYDCQRRRNKDLNSSEVIFH